MPAQRRRSNGLVGKAVTARWGADPMLSTRPCEGVGDVFSLPEGGSQR